MVKTKKEINKGNIIIILLALIAIVIIGIYYYFSLVLPSAELIDVAYSVRGMNVDSGLAICNQRTGFSRDMCLQFVAINNAPNDTRANDGSLCIMMSEQKNRDGCLYLIAFKTNNTELCGNITTPSTKTTCDKYVVSK